MDVLIFQLNFLIFYFEKKNYQKLKCSILKRITQDVYISMLIIYIVTSKAQ